MLETREGGCHCGRVRFRARVDLDLLSQCSCSICTKKGILHLPVFPQDFELLRGKNREVMRIGYTAALQEVSTHQHDFVSGYVDDLANVIDMDAIRGSGIKIGVDPLGGASVKCGPTCVDVSP